MPKSLPAMPVDAQTDALAESVNYLIERIESCPFGQTHLYKINRWLRCGDGFDRLFEQHVHSVDGSLVATWSTRPLYGQVLEALDIGPLAVMDLIDDLIADSLREPANVH